MRFFRIMDIYNNPWEVLLRIMYKTNMLWSDKQFIKVLFHKHFRRSLDINNPQSFSEKLQWLKLYNRKIEYKQLVDKYAVKAVVESLIGPEYVIPTYGVWNSVEDIEWDVLPNEFVLKTTNGGGSCGVILCKDKSKLDIKEAINTLKRSLKQDIYKIYREWPYKGIPKKIIAEKLLVDDKESVLNDYKVLCFNGVAKLIEYHHGRFTSEHTQNFYDRDWNLTSITQGSYGLYQLKPTTKPEQLDEMIRLSEVLAQGMPHIRVDWYIVNGKLYFGELTFFDGSGLFPFDKEEDDLLLGSWIDLPSKTV